MTTCESGFSRDSDDKGAPDSLIIKEEIGENCHEFVRKDFVVSRIESGEVLSRYGDEF